jgi:ParB family chromosome partitioning protein
MSTRFSDAMMGLVSQMNGSSQTTSVSFDIAASSIAPSAADSALPPSAPTSPLTVVPLAEIIVTNRIRQSLDADKTESLAHSIRQHGFRGVLWVRQVGSSYHLIAGGRRYAACQLAGIESVPVEVWNITDAEAIQLELLENFQREDLNPIEETEGVLRMLEVTLECERQDVLSLFNWHANQQRRSSFAVTDTGIRNSTDDSQKLHLWQQVEDVFALIGKFTPESFRVNRLPLLNLPEPIIGAISAGEIEYSKARLIARVKDPDAREELLEQAITQNMSREVLAEAIASIQSGQTDTAPKTTQQEFRTRASSVFKRLKSAKLEGRPLKRLEKLLEQIEELLDQKE